MDVRISPQAAAPQVEVRAATPQAAAPSGTGGAVAAEPTGKSVDFVAATKQLGGLLNSLRGGAGSGGSDAPRGIGTELQLNIDHEAGQVYGVVVEAGTGKVIHQIPTKEMRALMARARELLGPILDMKA